MFLLITESKCKMFIFHNISQGTNPSYLISFIRHIFSTPGFVFEVICCVKLKRSLCVTHDIVTGMYCVNNLVTQVDSQCPVHKLAKVGHLSEVFLRVRGQRDSQHMVSAICCVPWSSLTSLLWSHSRSHSQPLWNQCWGYESSFPLLSKINLQGYKALNLVAFV